jgi:hypothetical protein
LNLNGSQCFSDNRSLSEYLLSSESKNIFICRIKNLILHEEKYSDPSPNKDKRISKHRYRINEDYIYSAEIIKVYFGKIDTTNVLMHTQYLQKIDDTFLVYTRNGDGINFSFGNGYCEQRTKKLKDVSKFELYTLNQLSDIITNRKTKKIVIKNEKVIIAFGKFRKGKPIKTWIHNYDNGIAKTKIEYKIGKTTSYFTNGFIQSTYQRKKDSSISESYSESNDGEKTYFVTFYKNDIQLTKEFKHGKINKLYYSQAMIGYINDWIQYYESGIIYIKGKYTNGKKSGEWITYSENGEVLKKENISENK